MPEAQRVVAVDSVKGGATPQKTAALGNTGTVGVAKPCRLSMLVLSNEHTAAQWVKVYNKASAPSASDTPLMMVLVPAGSSFPVPIPPQGLQFSAGLSFRGTGPTGVADNATTATTATTLYASFAATPAS